MIVLLKVIGLINAISLIFTPMFLMRKDHGFNFEKSALSHLGGLKRTSKIFRLFILITGILEFTFCLVLIFSFGAQNFLFTIPLLTITFLATICSAIFNTKDFPKQHFFFAIITFLTAGIGGLVFSLEFGKLEEFSNISIVGIVISILLLSSLFTARKHYSLSATKEMLFIMLLVFWNLIYTIALFNLH